MTTEATTTADFLPFLNCVEVVAERRPIPWQLLFPLPLVQLLVQHAVLKLFQLRKNKCVLKVLGVTQEVRLTPDLLDHVQVSIGQGGGLQLQIVELEQADLGVQILEPGHRDLGIFCSFILFNWNTKDLGTLWGKVYYVIVPCFVNFLRTIRTNYDSNILVPKCPIQSKMLFSMIISKMIFS